MSKQPEPGESTKALTVYNVLRVRGTLTMSVSQVGEFLRDFWDNGYPDAWVADGAAWLIGKGFLRWENELLAINTPLSQDGKIVALARAKNDDSDLRIA